VLGFAVGDSEDGAFWTAFLRSLKARKLAAPSWSSPTPTPACRPRSARCCWARPGSAAGCTSQHFVLARVPKGNAEMVAAAIRTIFAQPDAEHVRSQLDVIAGMLALPAP
jgi:transposase-like protein